METLFTGAQQVSTSPPVPSQITSGQKIFISNAPWDHYCHVYKGGQDRGYNSFYTSLQQWHHYQIVTSPSAADLIFEISCKAVSSEYSINGETGTSYRPLLLLRILDPKTNVVLWSLTTDIHPGVLAKSRDKEFDKAVATVIEQVKQLSDAQHKGSGG